LQGALLWLFGIGVATTLVAVVLAAGLSSAGGTAAVSNDVVRQLLAAFDAAPWSWLGQATLLVSALALVSTVGERIARRRGAVQRVSLGAPAGAGGHREAIAEVNRRISALVEGPKPNVVAAFDELVRGAISVAASDIHVSPTPQGLKLTYRVQGTLYEVSQLDVSLSAPLATRIKVLARLDTYVRGTPQDGRLVMSLERGSIEARVSTLPTEIGERVVLRLVRGSRAAPDIEALGFDPVVLDGIRELLARPQGLFFVTGPVGSGKTTTLYAALQHVARTRGRTTTLVTLEDPIELELPFATQTQMHRRSGMTFASVLRSVLRQDPNVLMVGEIRDRETAEIAMQAGLTGHLFLTTVHGESAAGPFTRLVDMGIEPFVLASATVGCLSQRLARTLCTACRRERPAEAVHVDRFAKHGIILPPGRYYEPVGCDFCEGTGFTGRVPIAELLIVDPQIRQAVHARKTANEIYELAVAEGMSPLLRDGLSRALAGETSLGEVLRVAG
jgi:general secretion pathway protein E